MHDNTKEICFANYYENLHSKINFEWKTKFINAANYDNFNAIRLIES